MFPSELCHKVLISTVENSFANSNANDICIVYLTYPYQSSFIAIVSARSLQSLRSWPNPTCHLFLYIKLHGAQPCSFIYVLSMAAFAVKKQNENGSQSLNIHYLTLYRNAGNPLL